jgi:ABC-type sulfate transport system permease subunit
MDNTESIQQLLNQLKDVDPNQAQSLISPMVEQRAGADLSSWLGFGMFTAMMQMWWSWVIGIISIVAMWFVFVKANKPGWAAIIPIYNVWVTLEIIGKPWWWIILLLIPIVNIIVGIIMCYHLAKVFGQGPAFTVGLVLLPFIFMPILAWGKYNYTKPTA